MHDPGEMPERLAAFLSARDGSRTAVVHTYEAMVGGYSRLMARAEVEWSDGTREGLVLRGDPPAGKAMIETDRDLEYALLGSLADVVATPKVRHYDSTGEHLGTKCIVIDFVDGRSLQTMINGLDAADAADAHREDFVDTLASVHTIDASAVAGVLPSPTSWDDYLTGLIDKFRQADANHVESMPILRYVASWLDANRPPALPLRIVHSDFQPSNIMVTNDGEHLLIDWELAHIGDPREDIGYYLTYSGALGPSLFSSDPESFLARYRERTGFSEEAINMVTIGYFSTLAAITVYGQILAGAGAMALGLNSGLMTTYIVNALTIGHTNFLAGCVAPTTEVS